MSDGLVAVTMVCPGRGRPQAVCHLHAALEEDVPKAVREQATTFGPPGAAGVAWTEIKLDQPVQKSQRMSRLRKAERGAPGTLAPLVDAETQRSRPKPLRPIVGFATSGCFSYSHGAGVAVGVVLAEEFKRLESSLLLHGWLFLWARNVQSPHYFPVWARVLHKLEGMG
eukprot:807298-Amphidinium_carterae.1